MISGSTERQEESVEMRRLGLTNMFVTRLGFGSAEINTTSRESPGYLTVEANARLLNAVLDAGVNVIDTAECYGNAEDQIGNAISARRSEFFLFTKCGHAAGASEADWSSELLRKSIDRSLARLKTDHVDVMFLHSCPEEILRRGELVSVLQDARAAGKIRYLGYSGDGAAALAAIDSQVFQVVEVSVSILDQEAISVILPRAQRNGIGVLAKRPIANAVWRFKSLPKSPYLHSYWRRFQTLNYDFSAQGVEVLEGAFRFVMSVPVATAIVGTGRIGHWQENLRLLQKGALPKSSWKYFRSQWHEVARGWEGER